MSDTQKGEPTAMTKNDYRQLDAAILAEIAARPVTFTELCGGDVQAAAEVFVESPYKRPAWRFIDSRLQALRKRGKIRYVKGRWVPEPSEGESPAA